MGKFLQDFKDFAMKGNVVDMAIGVIIGGAFGKIVSSLVNDIIMPLVSVFTGGLDFKTLAVTLKPAQMAADGVTELVPALTLGYGMFIQNIVDFLIIAISIFVALRVVMKFKKKEEEAPAAPAAPAGPTTEELLTQIRDILQQQQK